MKVNKTQKIKTITEDYPDIFDEKVNEYLKKGWRVFSADCFENHISFNCRAILIKEEE